MNPYHWRFLLEFLAVAQFGPTKPSHRPKGSKTWNTEKVGRLTGHVLEYFQFHNWANRPVKLRRGQPDKLAIARWIKERHPEDYKRDDPDERIYREVIAILEPVTAMMGNK
jgi:hypothetical protein